MKIAEAVLEKYKAGKRGRKKQFPLIVTGKRGRPRLSDEEKGRRLKERTAPTQFNDLELQIKQHIATLKNPYYIPTKKVAQLFNTTINVVFEVCKKMKGEKRTKKKTKKAKVVKTPKPFWNNREKKNDGRLKTVSYITKSKNKGNKILSLPAEFCILEKLILKKRHFDFVACEYDSDVFSRLVANIKHEKLPIVAHCSPIGTLIRCAKENEYAHLILDYCGSLNKFHEDIAIAIRNNIVEVGGTISVTLSVRFRGEDDGTCFINDMTKYVPEKDRKNRKSIIAFEMLMNANSYKNYVIEETFSYKEGQGAMPMLLVIIRRVK
jgi:hypothetical protein